MKIKRAILEKLIREELTSYLRKLTEAPEKDVSVADADSDTKEKEKKSPPQQGKKSAAPPSPPVAKKPQKPEQPELPEIPDAEDPSDDELEVDASEEDPLDDPEADKEGKPQKVSDELTGKRIQSISVNEKSKLVPGGKEIVITFDEITDPLRILITKSGNIKYYFRGLHNEI